MQHLRGLYLFNIVALSLWAQGVQAQEQKRLFLEFEAGPVWQNRNDVRIPNKTGTSFSLSNLMGAGPYVASRFYLTYTYNKNTELRFLYAPLSYSGTGNTTGSIAFAGGNFAANTPTEGSYQFNSYRFTYRTAFYNHKGWLWKWGGTLKIRDARIALRQGNTLTSDYDLGVVPLLHVAGRYDFNPKWYFLFDMDGLAAPQGRAFDMALKFGYRASSQWEASIGYRTLEGGADVDRVYNFAWLNYFTFGIGYHF